MLNQSTEKSIEFMKKRAVEILDQTKLYDYKGTVSKLLGLTVEVKLPGLKIGDLCFIETYDGKQKPAEENVLTCTRKKCFFLFQGKADSLIHLCKE